MPQAEARPRRVALILSGGGAKGAYQIGVLKALRERGIVPDIYCGTSVGSFTAAMLASGRTVDELEALWLRLNREDVFTEIFHPRRLATLDPRIPADALWRTGRHLLTFAIETARSGGTWWHAVNLDEQLFDNAPLKDLIRDNVDIARLRASDRDFCIALTRLKPADLGSLVVVDKPAITHDHIVASSSLPLLFPPVAIGEEEFCDGAVVMNTPLKPAIDLGANEIYIVDLTPPTCNYRGNLTARIYQVLTASFSAALERDLTLADDLNSQYLAAFAQGRLADGKLDIVKLRLRAGAADQLTHRRYEYLKICKIAPACDMGGVEQFLDFSPESSRRLIAQGYSEAHATLAGFCEEEIRGPNDERLAVTCRLPAQEVATQPRVM